VCAAVTAGQRVPRATVAVAVVARQQAMVRRHRPEVQPVFRLMPPGQGCPQQVSDPEAQPCRQVADPEAPAYRQVSLHRQL
jgi:hypothetical protein